MRLFYGINLPTQLKELLFDKILEFQSYIPSGVKWVEKDNLHITFQFIGEVEASQLADLEDILLNSFKHFSKDNLLTQNIELYPNRDARQIWLRLKSENQELANVSKVFRKILKERAFTVDKNEFLPHITLGRIKRTLINAQADFILKNQINNISFPVNELCLFESNLTSKGPHYRIIKTYNLI